MVVRHPKRLTVEDFLALPDDGRRYELIRGELIDVSEGASRAHQRLQAQLGARMVLHASSHDLGEVYFSPFDSFLSLEDVFEPDILFVSKARLDLVRENGVHGAPDLVVEILSPSSQRRDRGVKLEVYAQSGVIEYWIANADAATIAIYRLAESAEKPARTLGRGDVLTSDLLPGFSVAIDELFDRT